MGLVVIVVKVVRIVKGLTITRAIGIRLPVRCEFARLAARGNGGRAMAAEEVASTEDADRELLAGSVGAGGITGEGSKEPRLRISPATSTLRRSTCKLLHNQEGPPKWSRSKECEGCVLFFENIYGVKWNLCQKRTKT